MLAMVKFGLISTIAGWTVRIGHIACGKDCQKRRRRAAHQVATSAFAHCESRASHAETPGHR
jgi:hypothetical protein